MSDDSLLAQIRAAPADDAPRMVYADELLAAGDERGEYIHLELARARQRRLTPAQRARRIELAQHEKRWAAELGCGEVRVQWRRGFPYAIVGRPTDVLRGVPLLRRLPITTLTLTVNVDTKHICNLPELALIDELSLESPARNPIDPDHLAALGEARLEQLRALSFRYDAMRDVLVDVVAGAGWFGQLTTLEVNRVSGAGLERLLATPPPRLARLSIQRSQLHERGAHALAAATSLDDLTLYDAGLRGALRIALAHPRLDALQRLWISTEDLHGVELPPCSNLTSLGLSGVNVELAPLLARRWPQLLTLDLSSNPIEAEGGAALAASTAFPVLFRLSLMNTLLQQRGATAFVHRAGLPALEELWLGAVLNANEGGYRTWFSVEEVKSWFESSNLEVL